AIDPAQKYLSVATQSGHFELFQYSLEPRPRLNRIGAAKIAAAAVDGARLLGLSFASLVQHDADRIVLSNSTGRLEWFRPSEASVSDWKPHHRTEMMDAEGDPVSIFGLAAAEPGRLIVAGIAGDIYCLDIIAGEVLNAPYIHDSDIFGMDFHSGSGRIVAVDSTGGWLQLNPLTCQPTRVVEPAKPPGSVSPDLDGGIWNPFRREAARTDVRFSPDGQLIGVAGHDGTVRVYAPDGGALLAIAAHDTMTRSAAFSADNAELLVGTVDGTITAWHLDRGSEELRLAGPSHLALDADGQRLTTITDGGLLLDIDALTSAPGATLQLENVGTPQLLNHPSGRHLLVYDEYAGESWSVERPVAPGARWGPARRHSFGAGVEIAKAINTDGGWLVGLKGQATSIERLSFAGDIRELLRMGGAVSDIAAGDGLVVGLDKDGGVALVDGGVLRARFRVGPANRVLAAGGRRFAVAHRRPDSPGDALCLCTVPAAQGASSSRPIHLGEGCPELASLPCRLVEITTGSMHRVEMTPSGEVVAVAVAGTDPRPASGEAWLLRAEDDWRPVELTRRGRVDALSFSQDSRWLGLGGRRGAELWHVGDAERRADIPTPSPVLDIRVGGPDAHRLATLDGQEPTVLRLWDPRPASFVEKACARWPEDRPSPTPSGVPPLPPRRKICEGAAADGEP
ncbi:MAG: hypothetical protein AAFX50_09025, partial [Acidobacteriota bacterium]